MCNAAYIPHGPARSVPRAGRLPALLMAALIGLMLATLSSSAADAALPGRGELVVVAADAFPARSLSREEVKRIYLGRKLFVEDQKLTPLDYLGATEAKAAFTRTVVGMDPGQFDSYWLKTVFSSGLVPPRKVRTLDEILETLDSVPGSVAYMFAGDLPGGNSGLRVLLRIPVGG